MELGPEDVSLLERYPLIRGPDMSLLEMCPHFKCYAQVSVELGPEDIPVFPYEKVLKGF